MARAVLVRAAHAGSVFGTTIALETSMTWQTRNATTASLASKNYFGAFVALALLGGCGGADDFGEVSSEPGYSQHGAELVAGPEGQVDSPHMRAPSERAGAVASTGDEFESPQMAPSVPGSEPADQDITVAYTCSNFQYVTVNNGYASGYASLNWNCSDGRAHVAGSLDDIACDKRSAMLRLRYYHDRPGTIALPYRTDEIRNSNGCGTYITFSRNTGDNTPHIEVAVWAESGVNITTKDTDWLNY